MSNVVYRLDNLRHTLYLHPDRKYVRGCQDCKLRRPECDQICLKGGTRKHVAAIVNYRWYQVIARWFRHLRTGKYTK